MKIEKQFSEVLKLIQKAKERAIMSVNTELIDLYWNIGKYISQKTEKARWGKGIVEQLADFLQRKEPELRGFSAQNIWRMKQFYETYKDTPILSTLLRELNWSNNLHILNKTKRLEEKEFYIRLAIQEKYSVRELERQIDSGLFERVTLSEATLSPVLRKIHPAATDIFRDEYFLDLMALPKDHSEMDLQKAIVTNLKEFILEFGKDFAFVGEQYRVQVGNKDFYIDLLFYHRTLQCLVAFDLKIDDFKPEYLGKMDFYLEALDTDVKKAHEKPSVGIILCKSKDNQVVEYSLRRSISPSLVAKYETELFDKKILERKLNEFFILAQKNKELTNN